MIYGNTFENSLIWPVKIAKRALQHGKRIIIRAGITPSGIMHIGNCNEVFRPLFVKKVLEELGADAKFFLSFDDFDPLRKVPNIILDENGEKIPVNEKIKEKIEPHLGKPVCRIPDPFECHESYADHFISLFLNELKEFGINLKEINIYRKKDVYKNKRTKEIIRKIFENNEKIMKIVKEFKKQYQGKFPAYVVCRKCGRILGDIEFFDGEKIRYVCKKRGMKKAEIEGCGNEEEINIEDAEIKLMFALEWAFLDWISLMEREKADALIELMGKDHFFASRPLALKILKELGYKTENLVFDFYEMFLVNGEKMSGSKGNVYTLKEMNSILEREVIYYFYLRALKRQQNIDFGRIYLLVDEFDRFEEEAFEKDDINIKASYYLCSNLDKKPERISYATAAMIGWMYREEEKIKEALERLGIKDVEINTLRCLKAKNWLDKYADKDIKERLTVKIVKEPKEKIKEEFKEILKEIIEFLEKTEKWDAKYLYDGICNIMNKYIPKEDKEKRREFMKNLYRILINKESGPKIGTVIFVAGKKAIEILKKALG